MRISDSSSYVCSSDLVPTVYDDGDVDVDDVAVFETLVVAWNAVADDVVHRGADRLGEAAIVQWRRNRAARLDEVVAELVQVFRRHPRLHLRGDHVESFRRQAAGTAHAFEAGLVLADVADFGGAPQRGGIGLPHQLLHFSACFPLLLARSPPTPTP